MKFERPFRTLYDILIRKAPIEAQLIVTRKCNLSCGYCTEYDSYSPPIPLEDLCRRIDALHRLHVVHITLLGGEPLLHPDIDKIVAYGRRRSTVSITSNGFLISDEIIEKLNAADLSHMQISIDSSRIDSTNFIQKTIKPLRPKLERLKEKATFDVHLATVLCEQSKDDVGELYRDTSKIGLPLSLSLIHDETGHSLVSGEPYSQIWKDYGARNGHFTFSMIDYEYSRQLLEGKAPKWHCRAGARSLYVDEFGKVQYCHSQRGRLDKPVIYYTWNDIRTQSNLHKGCEEQCAVDCVFRTSQVDNGMATLLKTIVQGALSSLRHLSYYNFRKGDKCETPFVPTCVETNHNSFWSRNFLVRLFVFLLSGFNGLSEDE